MCINKSHVSSRMKRFLIAAILAASVVAPATGCQWLADLIITQAAHDDRGAADRLRHQQDQAEFKDRLRREEHLRNQFGKYSELKTSDNSSWRDEY